MGSPMSIGMKEILLRLTVATLIGSVLGLNRELKGKPAGMRTYALVMLGAALLAMMCTSPESGQTPNMDALSRVMQGIVTGIGFLGAGVILRDDTTHRIQGLTTAATVWLAAGLGVACGIGYWKPMLVATVLALIVLIFGEAVERWVNKIFRSRGNAGPSE